MNIEKARKLKANMKVLSDNVVIFKRNEPNNTDIVSNNTQIETNNIKPIQSDKSPHPNINPETDEGKERLIEYVKKSITDEIYFSIHYSEQGVFVWDLHMLNLQLFQNEFLDKTPFTFFRNNHSITKLLRAIWDDCKASSKRDENGNILNLNLEITIREEMEKVCFNEQSKPLLPERKRDFSKIVLRKYFSSSLTNSDGFRKQLDKFIKKTKFPKGKRPDELLIPNKYNDAVFRFKLSDKHIWEV